MPLFVKPMSGLILKSSSLSRKIWGSRYVFLCRHVSERSCNENNTREPLKLGICRLENGKLRIVTSSHKDEIVGRQKLRQSPTISQSHQECALIMAAKDNPTSIIFYNEGTHDETESAFKYRLCHVNHRLTEENQNPEVDGDPPLVFAPEHCSYRQTLAVISAAVEAGNLCNSAAAKLRELCHHMHLESVIRSSAKLCYERTDDIIIRRDNSNSQHTRHDNLHVNRLDGDHERSFNEEKEVEVTRCTFLQDQRAPSPVEREDLVQSLPSVALDTITGNLWQSEPCTWYSAGEDHPKLSDAPSSGPSKEQLAYMHLRLSEEMPKFFEKSHDYKLYANDVLFDNRIMKVSTRGLPAYKATVQSLKYLSTAYMLKSQLEVLRITMEMEQGCIQARWRMKGVPLHSYVIKPWSKRHNYRYFDAFSTFHVGCDGLIHSHVLDKVMPSSENKVHVTSWAVRLGIMLGLVRPPAFDPNAMKPSALTRSLFGK